MAVTPGQGQRGVPRALRPCLISLLRVPYSPPELNPGRRASWILHPGMKVIQ
jgi:hypothetical protein